MKKKILATLMVLIALPACSFLSKDFRQYPTTLGSSRDISFYYIEPETLLDNLQQGNLDLLTPVVVEPDDYQSLPVNNKSLMWTYQEYTDIIKSLEKNLWPDGLKGWVLGSMYFYVDCQDSLYGFTIGSFRYFKEVEENGEAVYSVRDILIRPLDSDLTTGSGTTYPKPLLGWDSIDLNKVTIDPNKALQIAEKNGGKDFRLSTQNSCNIFLSFNPKSGYDGWKVMYSAGGTNIFEMRIDAYSGKFKLIN